MVTNIELTFVRNDTWEFDVNLFKKDNITPYELQPNDKMWFALKKEYADKECLIYVEQPSKHFKIMPKDTDIQSGTYVFDVGITFANGDIYTVITKSRVNVYEKVRCMNNGEY